MFQMRRLRDIVGVTLYAVQCQHAGGDWRTTNQRAAETEEAPVVRTPAEDARPSAAEAVNC